MNNLVFSLIYVLLGAVAIVSLLRFLFQLAQVSASNQVVAATRRISDPALNPFRKFLPRGRLVDTASLFVAWLAIVGRTWLVSESSGNSMISYALAVAWIALLDLLRYSLWVFIIAIFAGVIASWIAPTSASPYIQIARQLPYFLLRPVQSVLPSLGGLDFSPAIVLLALFAILQRVIPWLKGLVL